MCFTRSQFGSANADVYTIEPVDVLNGTQTDLSDSSTGAYNCAYWPRATRSPSLRASEWRTMRMNSDDGVRATW